MRRFLILLAVLLQIGALLWMAWHREDILRNGHILELETAPVDPRDIFRGDYVQLDYPINTLPGALARDGLLAEAAHRGSRVYTRLGLDEGRVDALEVSDRRPGQGPYLSGRLTRPWKPAAAPGELHIKYGIEKYFVEQGHGLELEQRRRRSDGLQTPLFVEVAVSEQGTAVIRGIRWGNLGMGLSMDPGTPGSRATRGASLTLENVSERPLKLLLAPNQCAFRLEPARFNTTDLPLPARPLCDGDQGDNRTVTLAPGEAHRERFEFDRSPWLVPYKGELHPIGDLPWNHRYRVVYRAPDGARDQGAWIGELRSAGFHGRGAVD